MNTLTEEKLKELEELQRRATPGPWQECGHSRGGCQCCQIWSTSVDVPVAETTRGKWGDSYPTLKGVGGDSLGSIGCKVEAVMEMIEYGEIPEGVGEANAAFISKMENSLPALISAARERERYRKALKMMLVGSCSCLTKTPEVRFHDEYCRYRIISEALGTPKELHPPASGMETSKD